MGCLPRLWSRVGLREASGTSKVRIKGTRVVNGLLATSIE